MRIAILSELFPRSIGGQEIRFAEVLVQQDHAVDVFCLAHNALVLPSLPEGFPQLVAETRASALPIVTANYPGSVTVSVQHRAGCRVTANPTATDIADGVEAVPSDWDRNSQLAALAAERLDWRQLAAELAPFLHAAANRPARPQRIPTRSIDHNPTITI